MCQHCGCEHTESEAKSSKTRLITIEQSLFSKNNHLAEHNRENLLKSRTFAINLMSSPGSGKTTLLEKTLAILKTDYRCAVIEGDQQTEEDAVRIRATGTPALQVNTGQGCHLDAEQISHSLDQFSISELDFVFIENVGNLVCPAGFDLGEQSRVVIFSVTEGENKPLKYPMMFQSAQLVIIHKTDLLPYLDFNLDLAKQYIKRINPECQILDVSSKSSEGMESWIQWLSKAFNSTYS